MQNKNSFFHRRNPAGNSKIRTLNNRFKPWW